MTTPLITRLEEAAEGSRELDELVALETTHPYGIDACDWDGFPPYTTSLDAALALAERVLPGWRWQVSATSSGAIGSVSSGAGMEDFVSSQADLSDVRLFPPALALCIAILRANHKDKP
jgi:hypothetical protein